MEGAGGTTSLRTSATHWTLAGDKHLLDVLQGLHERIVTKCKAANSSLEGMVSALDTASINLQNVNNRFMALSNSQFVESRVYDDDIDVATDQTPVKESPKPVEPVSELSKLKESLRVLEAYHDRVQILDSDSETGSDEDDRVVYKPKDLYADRPLPYIIGSQQWKSKWHAGLIPEDSDTESDTSKAEPPSEVYSDSADSDQERAGRAELHAEQRTISTTSSVGSEPTVPVVGKPADIAAELARRLGGNVPHIPEREPETTPSIPVPAKLYKPQQPTTATLFSDEPPPLDSYQTDGSYETESDEDIFAELKRKSNKQADRQGDEVYKNDAYVHSNRVGEVFNEPNPIAKPPPPLFEEPQDSESFEAPSLPPVGTDRQPDTSVKKPVGGISLFGNKGTESIGAAILKRHQRKSSSDEDVENDTNNVANKSTDVVDNNNLKDKTQKDIINNLFTKPNKKAEEKKIEVVKEKEKATKKVDLFADDLFDDIDDIFTTIKAPVKQESVKKSLFDEEDDLFADVVANKSSPKSNAKSISDDGLFSENATISNVKTTKVIPEVDDEDLFTKKDSAVDSDGLFTKNKDRDVSEKTKVTKMNDTLVERPALVSKNETSNKAKSGNLVPERTKSQKESTIKNNAAKSLFDSDSDNDIFSDFKSNVGNSYKNQKVDNLHKVEDKVKSKNIIDDFENEDSLFLSKETDSGNKNETLDILKENKNEITNKDIDSFEDDDSLFLQKEKPTTSTKRFILTKSDSFIKNNEVVDEIDDNLFNKTDKVLDSVENTPEAGRNSIIFSEDELFSNKSNKDSTKIKENSNILDTTNVLKNKFKSPSLFDEDEDIDELFNKNNETLKPKEINNKPDSSILIQNQGNDENNDSDDVFKANRDTKSDVVSSTKDNYLIQNIDNQIEAPNVNIPKNDDTDNVDTESISNVTEVSKETSNVESVDESADFEDPIPTKESKLENKTEFDNKIDVIQNEPLFPEPKESVSDEPDIFSDIFSDVPPEFERQKEPKKSKNVNALFDDDSDDEALFFKKNDMMTDDKPNVTISSQDDRLFQIFHDEPPAIDVDFTQKSSKIGSHPEKLENTNFDVPESKITDNIDKEQTTKNVFTEISNETDVFTGTQSKNEPDDAKKTVGKLKPMNFNINVNTLLPGASPKKTKLTEQVDGQTISTNNDTDADPKMVKSVSFDGDPESEVLNNKLSKERAKIQVKRRPSTRRARKEAVRRSGIDFGEDSTDNSSSTDISRKDDVLDKKDFDTNIEKTGKSTERAKSDIKDKKGTKDTNKTKVIDNVESSVEISKNLEQTVSDIKSTDEYRNATPIVETTDNLSYKTRSNVKSKVVYILNDEDIFTDSKLNQNVSKNTESVPNITQNVPEAQKVPETAQKISEISQNIPEIPKNASKNKILSIIDDDDDLFKSSSSKTNTTLGNSYDSRKKEIDNFDSDEDIFKASEVKVDHSSKRQSKTEIDQMEAKIDKLFVESQNNKVKNSLFDLSDDENELFGSKSSKKSDISSSISDSKVKKEVKLPTADVKGSLFGDDSDDDLFGVKTAKHKEPTRPSKPKEVTSKPSEPVFEDPLSLLGQEDDM